MIAENEAGPDAPPGDAPAPIAASERDVLTTAARWLDAGHAVELVTVARTWGSAPRPLGSMAAVRGDGRLVGSVSGGCIEKRLVEERGHGPRVASHRIADDEARRVGLTCGGRLELVFEAPASSAALRPLLDALDTRRRVLRRLDVEANAATLSPAGPGETFAWDGRVLERAFGPAWRVLLVGAGELSRYVASFALALDFDVVVAEPRAPFRETFDVGGVRVLDLLPDDAVAAHARDARSAVLALSHEPSLDDLALEEALGAECFHVAALGSTRSHEARRGRLRFMGVGEPAIERISAPAGLPIGSRSAAEIAVSIAAELVQARAAARAERWR